MRKPKKPQLPQPKQVDFASEELYWDALRYWMDHHWEPKSTTEFLKEQGYTAVKLWEMYQQEVRDHSDTARELRQSTLEFAEWRRLAADERDQLLEMVSK